MSRKCWHFWSLVSPIWGGHGPQLKAMTSVFVCMCVCIMGGRGGSTCASWSLCVCVCIHVYQRHVSMYNIYHPCKSTWPSRGSSFPHRSWQVLFREMYSPGLDSSIINESVSHLKTSGALQRRDKKFIWECVTARDERKRPWQGCCLSLIEAT